MAHVNPAPIRPPRKWLDDPEISKDIQDLYFFLYQLLQRTGGGTDIIEEGSEQTAINTVNIATNVSNIAINSTNISTNSSAISANTTNIATNASGIDQNETDISTNSGNITTNTTNISTNTTNISTNTTAISTNATNITTNATNIATNTGNISTNTTNIATNTSGIAQNVIDIDTASIGWPDPQYSTIDFQGAFLESVQRQDYVTISNEIIKLVNDTTVTLNLTPSDNERAYVKSTGKGFRVQSNKLIDGKDCIRFNKAFSGYWFSYSLELDTWSIL